MAYFGRFGKPDNPLETAPYVAICHCVTVPGRGRHVRNRGSAVSAGRLRYRFKEDIHGYL